MKKLLMILGTVLIASSGGIAIPKNTHSNTESNNIKPKTLLEGMSIANNESGTQIYNEAQQYLYKEFSFSSKSAVNNITDINIILINSDTQKRTDITNSNAIYNFENHKVIAKIYLKPSSKTYAKDQQLLIDSGFSLGTIQNVSLLINLSALTAINAPSSLTAINASSVTYNEVYTALTPQVLSAVKLLAPLVNILVDFTFSVYSDATGSPYQNVNLLGTTATVYVKVSATLLSILLSGSSPYIKITLPVATDLRISLNNLTSIANPTSITAQVANSVTYAEIKSVLDNFVLAGIILLAPLALLTDFSYNIYADSSGGTYQNINLSGRTGIVYIQVTANLNSSLIRGVSAMIKINLPAIKADISGLTQIAAGSIFVNSDNQTSVTKSEILNAISSAVTATIQNLAPAALITQDFTYDIYSDVNKTAYKPINLAGQTNTVFLNIIPNTSSNLLKGNALFQIILTGAKANLNGVTAIQTPSSVTAVNSSSVTINEAQAALTGTVLTAVQAIMPLAVMSNYTFQIFSNNQGAAYTNVNLSNNNAIVYVKITANNNDLLLQGSTGYIQVTLPKIKTSLMPITSISLKPTIISAANLSAVTENEIRNALDPLITKAVNTVNPNALLATDFTYTISNTPIGASYTVTNLSNISISNSMTLYIQINATANSQYISGSTGKIGVAVYGTATDISQISTIPLPNPIVANDPTAVTKTEVMNAITSQVLYAVLAVEPGATSNDFTFDIFTWDGNTYSPLNLSNNYGFIKIVITANSTSKVIKGKTNGFLITLLPIVS